MAVVRLSEVRYFVLRIPQFGVQKTKFSQKFGWVAVSRFKSVEIEFYVKF